MKNNQEVWKEIKEFKGYFISSKGRVKTKTGKIIEKGCVNIYINARSKKCLRIGTLFREHFPDELPIKAGEEFKNVPGTDYAVSNKGTVCNTKTRKYLNPPLVNGRREFVSYGKKYKVDHLVASLFIGDIRESSKIIHIDGNKSNDNADNLAVEERKTKYKPVFSMLPTDTETEQFKLIPESDGYFISNQGRVWSSLSNRIIKLAKTNKGYTNAHIRFKGKRKALSVHRLVAQAFINNPEDKPQVNHRDKNKQNNTVSNLEWVTDRENKDHARCITY